MSAQNNGGPAFPHPDYLASGWEGMSLRDYFAAKLMQGMVSSPGLLKVVTSMDVVGNSASERCAHVAYQWADAMLKAREQ
jgi:hypothetical protein